MEDGKLTLDSIAKELQISKTTVSRAISGKGRIGEETRQKVLEYVKQHDFSPRQHDMEHRDKKKTFNICVTLPGEENFAETPYFQSVLLSVYDYFSVRDYDVLVSKISAHNISALKRLVKKHKIDGVVLTRALEEDEAVEFLMEKEIPFVVIGSHPDPKVIQIDVDQEGGCKELTSILMKTGIENFALLCGDYTHTATQKRLKGFQQAFKDEHKMWNPELIFEHSGYQVIVDKIIDDLIKAKVECILCMDDTICVNVLSRLRREGLFIPGDIKVASFYNSKLLEEYDPPVTCLNFNIRELGLAAGKLLFGLINGENVPTKMRLGYDVILKESTKL